MRYLGLILFVVAAILGTTATFADEESPYMREVDEADKALNSENWTAAEAHLLNALRAEPANPLNTMLLSNLGVVRHRMGNDSLALEVLNIAAEKAPKSVKVLSNRAMVLYSMKRIDEAYNDYERILEVDSTDVEALAKHGTLAIGLGKLSETRHDAALLGRIAPDDERTYNLQAGLAIAEGNFNKATEVYGSLIEKYPSAYYYLMRSAFHLFTGHQNEALADINEAIRLSPNDGELYKQRANIYIIRGRLSDAQEDARRAIDLGVSPEEIRAILRGGGK